MNVKHRSHAKPRPKGQGTAKGDVKVAKTKKDSSRSMNVTLMTTLLVTAAFVATLACYWWVWGRTSRAPMPDARRIERMPTVPFYLPPRHELPLDQVHDADTEKMEAVRTAFLQSWNAYRRHGWGYDEYHPLSKSGSNLLGSPNRPLGYTIVDALDMLILQGLQQEYEEARDWIRDVLHWDLDGRLNVFETTIRVMGGLLSASALMRDPPPGTLPVSLEDAQMFQDKAEQLAWRLLPAFETPTGIPKREINLATGESFYDKDNFNSSSLAEATTIQLEFKYLAHLTKNQKYWYLAENPMFFVREATRPPRHGLLPIFLDPQSGVPLVGEVRLGSRGDSYYEYLVKQHLQTNYTEKVYRDMYEHAFDGIKSTLLGEFTGVEPPLLYTMELFPRRVQQQITWTRRTKQDHLVCFLGGAMMLGASVHADGTLHPPFSDSQATAAMQEDWRVGHELVRSCVNTYTESATGLGAEIVFFQPPTETKPGTRPWMVKRYVLPTYQVQTTQRDRTRHHPSIRATFCGLKRSNRSISHSS